MPKKPSRKDRLAKLQQKLQDTDMDSGGASGFVFIKPDDKVTLRILPEVGKMDYFFQTVGRHYLDDKKWIYCPNFTSEGKLECPVCEMRSSLFNSGEKANKELSKKLTYRKSYWMNVIVRGEEAEGVKIWTPGVTVMNQIAAYINDPDYGEIIDEVDGHDITISRKGSGFDTEYNVICKPKPSPISDKDSQITAWLESARDLSFVEVSMDPEEDKELSEGHAVYVLPYDRIQDELEDFFDLDFEDDDDDLEDEDYYEEDEEEEEVDEVKEEVIKRRRKRGAVRRRRK